MSFLKREDYIKDITDNLCLFTEKVHAHNLAGFFDINRVSEDYICGLLNLVYGWSLDNLNTLKKNYPGIDLGSQEDKIAIQVTTDNNRRKIQKTIDKVFNNEYYKLYPRVIVFIIGTKKHYMKQFNTHGVISFDFTCDVMDINTLIGHIQSLDTSTIRLIKDYIESETNTFCNTAEVVEQEHNEVLALYKEKLKALHIKEEQVNYVLEHDLKSRQYNYIIDSNKLILTGEYGTGKSHAIYILYLKQYKKWQEGKSNVVPRFIDAHKFFRSHRIEDLIGSRWLDRFNSIIFIDGLDELEYEQAYSTYYEINYLQERFNKCRVIAATRYMSFIDRTKCLEINDLSNEEIDFIYCYITGSENSLSEKIQYNGSVFGYYSLLRKPFFLLIYCNYINEDHFFHSELDIISYFIDRVLEQSKTKNTLFNEQIEIIAAMYVDHGLSAIHETELDFRPDWDSLLKSGFISRSSEHYISFTLPLIAQWLAAQALKDKLYDIENVIKNRTVLMKWRYPLSMWCGIVSFNHSKSTIQQIIEKWPAIAGLIIKDGIKVELNANYPNETEQEYGEILQECMKTWIKGLGPLAIVLHLSIDGQEPNTLYISYKNQFTYSWSYNKFKNSIITVEPKYPEDGFCKFYSGGLPAQSTAPWIITYSVIKNRLQTLIRKHAIPVELNSQLGKEQAWKYLLKYKNKSNSFDESIDIRKLLLICPDVETAKKYVPEQQFLFEYIISIAHSGKKYMKPPFPTHDIDIDGGWVWSYFSEKQLLKRCRFEFTEGLKEYKNIVETCFENFKNELAFYSCLPGHLIGELQYDYEKSLIGGHEEQPVLFWYILPIDKCNDSRVDISYENNVSENYEQIWDKIISNRDKYRWDNKEFIYTGIHGGICFRTTATLVTDWVYDRLEWDLRQLGWIN